MIRVLCRCQLQRRALAIQWPGLPACRSRLVANLSRALPRDVRAQCTDESQPSVPAADVITSVNNAYIKHCVKLRQRSKYRNGLRRVLLCGAVLLNEIAAQTPVNVLVLFIPCGSSASHVQVAASRVIEVNEAVLKKLSGLETAAGLDAIAEVELPAASWTAQGKGQQLQRLLALDGVQDPGNMGTLLRTARAFGWDAAWLLPGCCDPFNDKALRASRGAALTLPLASGSWDELLQVAGEHQLQLLAAEPEPEGEVKMPSKTAKPATGVVLVLGAEGRGLSSEALQHCKPLAIPMPGTMESLNVSVAGGILMFALSDGLPSLTAKLGAVFGGGSADVTRK